MTIYKNISSAAGAGLVAFTVSLAGSSSAMAGGVLNSAVNDWTGGAVMCEIVH